MQVDCRSHAAETAESVAASCARHSIQETPNSRDTLMKANRLSIFFIPQQHSADQGSDRL